MDKIETDQNFVDSPFRLRFVRQLRRRTRFCLAINYLRRCLTSTQVGNRGAVLMRYGESTERAGLIVVI